MLKITIWGAACVLHNAISNPDAGEPGLKLYGEAAAAGTPLRDASRQAWRTGYPRITADVLVLELTEAVLIERDFEHARVTSTRWLPGHGRQGVTTDDGFRDRAVTNDGLELTHRAW